MLKQVRRFLAVLAAALAAALAVPLATEAQTHSDIYVAAIQRADDVSRGAASDGEAGRAGRAGGAGGALRIGPHENITRRAGYDNQPHFTTDGAAILYTRIDESGQADIWRYDVAAGTSRAVTRTSPESEYSATPIAGGGFTVIRVERDSTQRLWRFDDDGTNASVVFENVKPVGYHAWGDATRAGLFVLGEPATLQLADTRTGTAREMASGIGRAIQKVPGRPAISFLQLQAAPEPAMLKLLDIETGAVSEIGAPPDPAAEYHAWLPDGVLITAAGSRIYARDPATGEWIVIGDVSADNLRVSRLAVSPDGARLAFVGEPVTRPR